MRPESGRGQVPYRKKWVLLLEEGAVGARPANHPPGGVLSVNPQTQESRSQAKACWSPHSAWVGICCSSSLLEF